MEVEVGPVDPLHGHAERAAVEVVVDLHGLEESEQGRTVIPRGVGARHDDVVALQRRQRDERHLLQPMRAAKSRYSCSMALNTSWE